MKKFFVRTFFLLVVSIGIYFLISRYFFFSTTKVRIDNPTESYITVYIDHYPGFGIAPYSYERYPENIKTHTGHSIAINDSKFLSITLPDNIDAVMINPTQSTYVLWTERYSPHGNSYHDSFEIRYHQHRFVGPFTLLDDIVIPIIRDSSPSQGLPIFIKVPRWKQYVTLSKLYRYDDFLPAYYSYIKGHID